MFSTSLQEHIKNLRLIFHRLLNSNFKIQLDKFKFSKTEVAYLGYIVTPEGGKPNPDKIETIKNYYVPKTTK